MHDEPRSLYLIGMPGSGKTSLGRALAAALALPFVDVDAQVEAETGMSIPSLFAQRGEAAFRALESQALSALAQGGPQVMATGGGIVLDPRNVAFLRRTGLVLWVDRPVARIAADVRQDTRPLLHGDVANRLAALYAQREPLYRGAAHLRLLNAGSLACACKDTLVLLQKEGFGRVTVNLPQKK